MFFAISKSVTSFKMSEEKRHFSLEALNFLVIMLSVRYCTICTHNVQYSNSFKRFPRKLKGVYDFGSSVCSPSSFFYTFVFPRLSHDYI